MMSSVHYSCPSEADTVSMVVSPCPLALHGYLGLHRLYTLILGQAPSSLSERKGYGALYSSETRP